METKPKVVVTFPCPTCEGTGRVDWDLGVTGGSPMGPKDRPCADCLERGYIQHRLGFGEFKKLLGETPS